MGDPQIVVERSIARINPIKFRGCVVRRAGTLITLSRLVGSRSCDQCDAALGERLFQRLKRHLGIMCPAIERAVAECLIIFADAMHVGDRCVVFGGESEVLLMPGHLSFPPGHFLALLKMGITLRARSTPIPSVPRDATAERSRKRRHPLVPRESAGRARFGRNAALQRGSRL